LTPSPEQLVARVEPVLRQYAANAEAERQLAPEAVAALIDAGLFRTWTPRAYGGLEMDPIPALQMFEALSRIDSAAGWVAGNSSAIASFSQVFADDGSAEMFADPRTVVAGAYNPPGGAVPVEGGYRVTGRWPFGSASTYATWLTGLCLVMDGDAPRLGADGNPVVVIVAFKASEAEIPDSWHTLGMRGTGSHDFRVENVFVPERRSFVLGPWDRPGRAFAGPLYRLGIWIGVTQIAITGLGIARAALDDLVALAATKTPSYTQTGLADRPIVHERVARSGALISAGRAAVYAAMDDAWQFVQGGGRITGDACVPLGLASSFGMEAAVQAVDIVHGVAGTSAIRTEQPFQRYFRDVHTISQHAFASAARYESLGKMMLGRQSDWAFYYV
jgi:alkylation response protein AidB-like acyl-CoA dehydrogenase